MLGPIIEGERIRLEPAREEYLAEYVRWFSDLDVTRYLPSRCPMSMKQEHEWFDTVARDRSTVHWNINVGNIPIGVTGINRIDWQNQSGVTGTIIGVRSEWGKGYASEAVKLRSAFAFRELNLETLETQSFASNTGMHRALGRSGYRRIGVRRRARFREGTWHDMVLFELLRDEWEALQRPVPS